MVGEGARPLAWEIGDRPRLPITPLSSPAPEVANVWRGALSPGVYFPRLKGIDVYTNTDCPYMCGHCFLTTRELKTKDRMSLGLVKDIVNWTTQPGSNIEEITLLGGEFSMHPEAAEIIKLIGNTRRSDGTPLHPRIVTNGGIKFQELLKDEEVVRILQDSRVAVSIEAADEKLNDKFRGRGASQNAWKTVDLLQEKEIPVDINCTVMRATLTDTMRLADYARYKGAKRVNFHSFSPIGRGHNLQNEELTPQEWGKFCDLMVGYKYALLDDYGVTDFTVDVEQAYDFGIPTVEGVGACAIADRTNLQFRPPQQGSQECTVIACGLTMPDPDKSAYVFRQGNLFQRREPSEHSLLPLMKSCTGCPLPFREQPDGNPQPICVYTRIDHDQARANAYRDSSMEYFRKRNI